MQQFLPQLRYMFTKLHGVTSQKTYSQPLELQISLINTVRTGSFKLFKRRFPGFLTILTL